MTSIPDPTNPIAEALANYNQMRDALSFAEDQLRQAQMVSTDLLRENGWLREHYDSVKSERDRLQAYAVDLTTRIDVIVETAQNAKSEARKFAVRPVVPPAELADDGAAELVARLPPNEIGSSA